jgi:uncharacterized protein with GYD domain|tara:strand:- start:555 stop:869 length:315 start_codon:yes stop_codon:yes gene_type:complete
MTRGNYTQGSWASLVDNPQNRLEIVKALGEEVGVKITSAYYSLGEKDFVIISEAADVTDISALLMKVASTGSVNNLETTVLMTGEDVLNSLTKASSVGYRPPGK